MTFFIIQNLNYEINCSFLLQKIDFLSKYFRYRKKKCIRHWQEMVNFDLPFFHVHTENTMSFSFFPQNQNRIFTYLQDTMVMRINKGMYKQKYNRIFTLFIYNYCLHHNVSTLSICFGHCPLRPSSGVCQSV